LRCRRTARLSSWIAGLAALVLLLLWSPAPASAAPKTIPGFNQPVYATAPRGDGQRLFVLERRGMVRLVRHGRIRKRPFLDIRRQVRLPFPHNQFRDQSGAFSLAFAPDYRRSGRLYVLYTSRDRRVHVDEFRSSRGGASSRSRRPVLSFHQEGLDDLGGDLAFGPDGFLYISLGEGNHPERSQNPGVLNGKLLRIDPRPTGGQPYGIPAGNPFVLRPGTRPEIFASGLRNPWRFSFYGHKLLLSDVGEDRFEEVNVLDIQRSGGANLGWPIFEGPLRHEPGDGPFVAPALTRAHGDGVCAIVGGFVVRGRYLYGDVCSGALRSARVTSAGLAGDRSAKRTIPYLGSFGRDGRGRIYGIGLSGSLYRLGPSVVARRR
jgi:glucose/arabinose dehydrogenase